MASDNQGWVSSPGRPNSSASISQPRGAPENPGRSTHIELDVIRASGLLPIVALDKLFGHRRFYITITDGTITKRTKAVESESQMVIWGETFNDYMITTSSQVTLKLFASRVSHQDSLVGTLVLLSGSLLASGSRNFDFALTGDTAMQPAPRVILRLAVTVVSEARPPAESTYPAPTISSHDSVPSKVEVVPVGSASAASPRLETIPIVETPSVVKALPQPDLAITDEAVRQIGLAPGKAIEVAEYIDRAPSAVDQAMDLWDTWSAALERIDWIVTVCAEVAEVHPYAKMAWSVLSFIPQALLNQVKRDDNVRALAVAMHNAFDFIHEASVFEEKILKSAQKTILVAMFTHTCACGDFIQSYAKDTKFRTRLLKNVYRGVDAQIEGYCSKLTTLREAFLNHAMVTIEKTAFQIQSDVGAVSIKIDRMTSRLDGISGQLESAMSEVSDSNINAAIREIPYSLGGSFRADKGCLEGTRTAFLDYITDWVNDPDSTRGLVLFGQAGTGKSSIAHEIARRFREAHRLTSSFVFSRGERSSQESHLLFTGLARDLSSRYPTFRASLAKIIQTDAHIVYGSRDLASLFRSLLLQPFGSESENEDPVLLGPIFVVIDGLDEAADAAGPNGLHTFLAERICELPENFRILITSRPERDIEEAFSGSESISVIHMDDPGLSASTEQDIYAYLQANLPHDIFGEYGGVFAEKAEKSFQWAAAVCRYIQKPPGGLTKRDLVQRLLYPDSGRRHTNPLDTLYLTILKSYFDLDDRDVLRRYQSVMGQLFVAFEPLCSRSLQDLRLYSHAADADEADSVPAVVSNLGSLLSNVSPGSDPAQPITPLHTSFRDFLTARDRAGEFWVDPASSHRQMIHCCFGLMLDQLHFNMCRLVTSYNSNSDVPGIHSLISQHISGALSYASRFWDHHLRHVPFDTELVGNLREFLETKLPFWLETLSLHGCVDLALQALSNLKAWLAGVHDGPVEPALSFLEFVDDASAFVQYFAMPMSQSAPHIYLSAFPFSPSSSLVFERYANVLPNLMVLQRGRLTHWPAQKTVISVGTMSLAVAFSPDGTRIASGQADGSVRIFVPSTGRETVEPFTGHTNQVYSVAFSPDGRHVVSGSSDWTIRVWDVAEGRMVGEPFTGHTSWVNSVAFSPDGQRIVSGSDDCTIRVWGSVTGQIIAGPFTGHSSSVESVAFSPDGLCVVSGSTDKSIRIWNGTTGRTIVGPLEGHTDQVTSVVFSQDGGSVISGSGDNTIRIWDAMTGKLAMSPLEGHANLVMSVSISLDGQHIVSGSADSTVRIWDITTGRPVAEPLTGHGSCIRSVALSPDGRHIASGSEDNTVRIWDAIAARAAKSLDEEHVGQGGPSISLPRENQLTVSGSGDHAIVGSDDVEEQMDSQSLGGHVDLVWSVAFSPDGCLVASGSKDRTIRIWNAPTGQTVVKPLVGHTDGVNCVKFSPDCRRIVSGSRDGTVRVWDTATGQVVVGPLEGHQDEVKSVAFSPDGRRLASGSSDATIRIWDAVTGRAVAEPFASHTDAVRSVAFSPDGQHLASGSSDGTIRVWDATTGRETSEPFTEHTQWVFSVTFSPDGRRIASASLDNTIRIWDAATGQQIVEPFEDVANFPLSASFSPDGRHIVSGWADGTIHILDATTGRAVSEPLKGHAGDVMSVAFSPDGRHIVSGSGDTSVRLWTMPATAASEAGASDPNGSPTSHSGVTPTTVNFRAGGGGGLGAVDDDGWIRGAGGELLIWIPEPHRVGLPRPGNVWVRARNETVFDDSRFVHGSDWTMCFEDDQSVAAT